MSISDLSSPAIVKGVSTQDVAGQSSAMDLDNPPPGVPSATPELPIPSHSLLSQPSPLPKTALPDVAPQPVFSDTLHHSPAALPGSFPTPPVSARPSIHAGERANTAAAAGPLTGLPLLDRIQVVFRSMQDVFPPSLSQNISSWRATQSAPLPPPTEDRPSSSPRSENTIVEPVEREELRDPFGDGVVKRLVVAHGQSNMGVTPYEFELNEDTADAAKRWWKRYQAFK